MAPGIIDVSRVLGPQTPAWPGDARFSLDWTTPHGGAELAVSRLTLSPHLGTHLDAPLHVDPSGADAAALPLGACLGECEVIRLPGHLGPIAPSDLPPGWRPAAPRALFATDAWPAGSPLPERFAGLAPALVDALADAGVVLVGLDTPSVDASGADQRPAHRRCVARGVMMLEGLDLTGVPAGRYTLVALPLRLAGAEASPVRAVLVEP